MTKITLYLHPQVDKNAALGAIQHHGFHWCYVGETKDCIEYQVWPFSALKENEQLMMQAVFNLGAQIQSLNLSK